MKTFITTHNKVFKAEWLKLRNSGMIWLLLGITAFIPILFTLAGFFTGNHKDGDVWNSFIASNFQGFTGFFFPVFVVIIILRIVYLEHRSDTWKLMETQPVSKAALFFSKWEVAVIISLLSLIGLLLFSIAGGFILQIFLEENGFKESSIDWSSTAHVIFRYWIGALGIISIQYFLSLLIKSFAWPMSIGLVAIIIGSTLVQFGIATWWPYATSILTIISYEGSVSGQFLLSHEKLSLVWSILFLWLGYQYFVNKTISRAFLSSFGRISTTVIILSAFLVSVMWLNSPKVLNRYDKTVLAGELKSKSPISFVALIQAPLMDTIVTVPVEKDGTYHAIITKDLIAGMYYLRAGKEMLPVYFGPNDSLYIEMDLANKKTAPKISGTRLAENQFLLAREDNNSDWELTDYAYNLSPNEYAAKAMSNLKDKNKNADRFKTIDRIKLSEDFIESVKKRNNIYYASLLTTYYPRIHNVYYPNQELKYPEYIQRFLKETDIYDESLISFQDYRAYLIEALKNKTQSDSAYFTAIQNAFHKGNANDYLLYDAAQDNLFKIKDSIKRDRLLTMILANIENETAKQRLLETQNRVNSIRRGQKAHNFIAEALNGKKMTLSDLANRYVVIDVWATWCKPCKQESPYYEQLAQLYTSDQVAFVSVSIDEEKRVWTFEAMEKKNKMILQLWSPDAELDFNKGYAVNSIPRFILIDPKGNIVNSNMPRPSDPEFEAILQKEIPSLGNRL